MMRFKFFSVVIAIFLAVGNASGNDLLLGVNNFNESNISQRNKKSKNVDLTDVIRHDYMEINPEFIKKRDGISQIDIGGINTLTLNLFDNVSLQANKRYFKRISHNMYGWGGIIEGGMLEGYVIFSVVNQKIYGSVTVGENVYKIEHVFDNIHIVKELYQNDSINYSYNDERYIDELMPMDPIYMKDSNSAINSIGNMEKNNSKNNITVDIMVLYTPQSGITKDEINSKTVYLPEWSFKVSEVKHNIKINLVHYQLVQYIEKSTTYDDIRVLENYSDGELDSIHTLRCRYKPDVIALFGNYKYKDCGIASPALVGKYLPENSFVVVNKTCFDSDTAFTHELGHIMGLHHDWYTKNYNTYAHGYISLQDLYTYIGPWKSIMANFNLCGAKNIVCKSMPWWSNPDRLLFNTYRTGVPDGTNRSCVVNNLNNPPCDADSVKGIEQSAPIVATYGDFLSPNIAYNLTGKWKSTYNGGTITMDLTQEDKFITGTNAYKIEGTWSNSATGCSYVVDSGNTDINNNISISFAANNPGNSCCSKFTYSGIANTCDSVSLNWKNDCSFDGNRDYDIMQVAGRNLKEFERVE